METHLQSNVAGPHFKGKVRTLLATQAKRQDDEARKSLVCASELEEWLEVGFNAANVARVADRAGVSTATLYRLYPDRNKLNLDTLEIGNQIVWEIVQDAPQHPHPFRNLVELTHHIASLWQQSSVQMFFHTQGYILQTETEITADARAIATKFGEKFRKLIDLVFDHLVVDGFLEDRNRQAMFYRLIGPIEIKTRGWAGDHGIPFKPATSWYDEAIKIVEEFFCFYGTAKFKSIRQQSSIAPLDGHRLPKTPVKEIDHAKLYADLDRDLPFLRDLEDFLASNPEPANAAEFMWQVLQRLLTKSPNRLDVTNRQNRIVASAAIVTYTQGFRNLSMARVAKQAGVSTATLYRLYPTDRELYKAAYGLGLSIYLAWLARESRASNPLAQFTQYASFYVETFMDGRARNARSMDQLRAEPSQIDMMQRYSELRVQHHSLLWQKRFSKLQADGYIKEPASWDMIHTLIGPGILIAGLQLRAGIRLEPQRSWFEECWGFADEFFQIYGTPHFHAMRKKMRWDDALEAYRANSI
ncbi:MAG: TetR/AcrR family transcriptional regulator [Hyphomonadaceae bacterium]